MKPFPRVQIEGYPCCLELPHLLDLRLQRDYDWLDKQKAKLALKSARAPFIWFCYAMWIVFNLYQVMGVGMLLDLVQPDCFLYIILFGNAAQIWHMKSLHLVPAYLHQMLGFMQEAWNPIQACNIWHTSNKYLDSDSPLLALQEAFLHQWHLLCCPHPAYLYLPLDPLDLPLLLPEFQNEMTQYYAFSLHSCTISPSILCSTAFQKHLMMECALL